MARSDLEAKADSLPECAGIYTFRDARGKIIYVGKAKSLRSRVRSYFRGDETLAPRTQALVKSTRTLDFIVTSSEIEALILECNLIKHFKPRYNVSLKDDKKYPYIKVTTKEPFPSISATRDLRDRTARYFGPYTDARAMRRSLKILCEIFPIRTCKRSLPMKTPDRGCLNYHIGKCIGPCRGEISSESYKRVVRQVCEFLSGKVASLIRQLKARMEAEAERRRFEEAACLRDQIAALEKIALKQTVVSPVWKEMDVVGVRRNGGQAMGVVLKVREGKIIGKEAYRLGFEGQPGTAEITESFLEQYLDLATDLPKEIVLEERPAEAQLIEQWLREKTGQAIRVRSPRGGKRRELVRMAAANAQVMLAQAREAKPAPRIANSVKELAKWLGLTTLPVEIEAFDISTTQGAQPVGSRVFFKNGRPVKNLYRHYTIKTVEGQDDFAMMREVVRRSWTHVAGGEEDRPDLMLIDGGLGQVTSAIEGMEDAGADRVSLPAVIGIAKRLDELYVPGRSEPIQIPHTSSALRLLQRMRDEAHRFAITHHRKARGRESMKSALEGVPGVGPVLARRLLSEFGSIEGLKKASPADLLKIKGMTAKRVESLTAVLAGAGGGASPEAADE